MTVAIVTGGRDYADAERVAKVLGEAVQRLGLWLIIEGGATGADSLARDWCLVNGVCVIEVPAEWKRDGDGAGHIRNALMLAMLTRTKETDRKAVIAFPGGKGTAGMKKIARAAGVKVHEA